MPKITRVEFVPKLKKKEKVAAYTRVSCEKDTMLHSLSTQVSFYSDLIQSNSEWEYAGVYTDEALTGTKEDRADFQRMIADCKAGKIDRIITKSISRFARNTVTLLETVRMLKSIGIDVYFEEQNIHSMSADGELMLTILASYAQEESLSASENQKWRIKMNFEEGIPWCRRMLGYELKDGKYIVVPNEALIVKRIFKEYLEGKGSSLIANRLTEDGVPTKNGGIWLPQTVKAILRNYTYTGNLLLQKTFKENHITKRKKKNDGQHPMYHAEESHEAIIDLDTFNRVQAEIERRAEIYAPPQKKLLTYPYTGLIRCAKCGKSYHRKKTSTQFVWICSTFNTRGKKYCASKQIPESAIDAAVAEITDGVSEIDSIVADDNNTVHFNMKNGEVFTRTWLDRSRSESWTQEMKEAARQKTYERTHDNGKSSNNNSGN